MRISGTSGDNDSFTDGHVEHSSDEGSGGVVLEDKDTDVL